MSGEVAAIGCAFFWALSAAIVRGVAVETPSMLVNALRSVASAGLYIIVIVTTGRLALYQELTPRDLLFLGMNLSVGIVLGDTAYYASMRAIGLSRALTISSTYPLLTAVLAGLFLGEVFGWRTWLGFVLCVTGIIVVARSGVRTGDAARGEQMRRGVAFALAAAGAWAVGTIALRIGSLGLDPVMVNSLRISGVAVVAGAWAGARGEWRHMRRFGRRQWLPLIVSGLTGSVIGATLYLLAVQRAGAPKAAVLASLAPLFSVPMSALVGETVSRRLIVGVVVAVAGVMLVV